MKRTKQAVANHEAGHVVVALEWGRGPVQAVVVNGPDGWLGMTSYPSAEDRYTGALIGIAGLVGEGYYLDPDCTGRQVWQMWRSGILLEQPGKVSRADARLINNWIEEDDPRLTRGLMDTVLETFRESTKLFQQVVEELVTRGRAVREHIEYDYEY
jgi:hypothetical protein